MWRSTEKPAVYRHDDSPCCQVEVIQYRCADCGLEQTTYHRVSCADKTPGHEAASKAERKLHATCSCGAALKKV